MGPLLIALLLAAAPAHRARGERAEALGHMQEAAREYEAAWQEEQAPELLYRLGIVRRKLKQYGKAREAFRAYLREAPEGGLRDEVERQLAKLEVLIEAQTEDYSDEPPKKPPARALPSTPAPPVQTPPVQPAPAQPAPVETAPLPAPVAPALPKPVETAPLPAPAETARPIARRAPAEAVAPAPAVGSRAAPWLAGAAVATAAAGAYFWWDGARISRDLDARFASGDLAPADRPSYSRAHAESIAGRVLAAAAAGLLAGAVALWW